MVCIDKQCDSMCSPPSTGSGESTDTLHILTLLKDIMGTFSLNSVKAVCETILRVMTLSNVVSTFYHSVQKVNNTLILSNGLPVVYSQEIFSQFTLISC